MDHRQRRAGVSQIELVVLVCFEHIQKAQAAFIYMFICPAGHIGSLSPLQHVFRIVDIDVSFHINVSARINPFAVLLVIPVQNKGFSRRNHKGVGAGGTAFPVKHKRTDVSARAVVVHHIVQRAARLPVSQLQKTLPHLVPGGVQILRNPEDDSLIEFAHVLRPLQFLSVIENQRLNDLCGKHQHTRALTSLPLQ